MRNLSKIFIWMFNVLLMLSIFSACGIMPNQPETSDPQVQPIATPETQPPALELGGITIVKPTQLLHSSLEPGWGWGIQLKKPILPEQINLAHQAHATWNRYNVNWAILEPTPGERNWAAWQPLETDVQQMTATQIQVIGLIIETPQWATGKETGCGPVAPEYLDDFAAFMGDVVARYSQPPYNIHVWELWNEPDVAGGLGCWGNTADPYYGGEYYAQMLAQVYPAIKAADSRAQVLVGGLLLDCDPNTPPSDPNNPEQPKDCSPARFFEGILRAGGGNFFDGVSFHGYDFYQGELGHYGMRNWNARWDLTGPILIPKAQYLNGLMAQYNLTDKYLADTEIGLICGTDGTQPPCLTPEFETTKAIYLAQAFAAARANNVQIGIWYNLTGWRGSGLLTTDLQPIPAYTAFQTAAQLLENTTYYANLRLDVPVTGYAFQNSTQQIWVLWSNDLQTHTLELPALPQKIEDIFGADQPLNQTIEISGSPLYIVWSLPASN